MTTYKPADLGNGALLVERAKVGTGGQCCEAKCTRAGRFRIRIADHYVKGEDSVSRYAYLCPKCSAEMATSWEEFAGRAPVEAVAA
jgi:hypothetical protein